jgi:hypothetical protein
MFSLWLKLFKVPLNFALTKMEPDFLGPGDAVGPGLPPLRGPAMSRFKMAGRFWLKVLAMLLQTSANLSKNFEL